MGIGFWKMHKAARMDEWGRKWKEEEEGRVAADEGKMRVCVIFSEVLWLVDVKWLDSLCGLCFSLVSNYMVGLQPLNLPTN